MRAWGGNLHARSDHNFAPEWHGNGCYCQRGLRGFGWCNLIEPEVELGHWVEPWLRRHVDATVRHEDDGAGSHQREQDQDRRGGEAGGS